MEFIIMLNGKINSFDSAIFKFANGKRLPEGTPNIIQHHGLHHGNHLDVGKCWTHPKLHIPLGIRYISYGYTYRLYIYNYTS